LLKLRPLRRRRARSALAGATLLAALAAEWPRAAAQEPQPVAELELVEPSGSVEHVMRRMETGFLMAPLQIPGARFMGRVPLTDLDPAFRAELEASGPGRPIRHAASGGTLVAQLPPASSIPAALGESEYRQDASRIGARVAFTPTNADLLTTDVPVDSNDLRAVCEAKKKLVAGEIADARAAVAALPASASLPEIVGANARLGGALSFTDDMAGALRAFGAISDRLEADPRAPRERRAMALEALGLLHLRRGELDNCVMHHDREMCLFPLSKSAAHHTGDGARQAFDHFSRYLELDPDSLEVRWLLNIAAMTAGTYPEGVPDRFRIGPQAFASEEDPGRFWDVAAAAGFNRVDNAGGTIADDFDGDGLIDVVLSSRDPCEPLRIYKNRGDGSFEDVSEKAGLMGQLGGLDIVQTDYDNDGRPDIFVMRGGWETPIRNSLLHNDGGMHFTDVTERSGLGGLPQRTHSAAWADFDGDGWLDVFLGHELSWSQLMRNRGDGTFEDVTEQAGIRFRSLTKGVVAGDIDNDGWPDIYVSNFGAPNLLYHNLGHGRFEQVAKQRGVSEPYFSFTTWFFDYDNDGWLDLLVVTDAPTVEDQPREYLGLPQKGETLRVYHNKGDGTFEDATQALGLAKVIPTMGANFGDIDNDGWLDFYLGTGAPSYATLMPNRMFRNHEGKRFVDVTQSTGTGHLQKGHGVAFADFDNDGDDDVFASLGGAFLGDKYQDALFENPGHGGHWVSLKLVGRTANRAAIGARIRLVLDEDGRETQRTRSVTSGGSFGASPLMQHVGIGKTARIKRVEIDWPGAKAPQVLTGVPVDAWIEATQGEPGFKKLARKRFRLGGPAAASAR
jgi:VCBS repeat protein/ASPIC/UnbV protein